MTFWWKGRMFVIAVLALALLAACATTVQAPQVSENLLADAGFKTVAAITPLQQQHLRTLQQGVVSEMQQTGKHYYVYPDVADNRLYVGTPDEFRAYQELRSRNGLPNPPPSNATNADLRQYLKRDAAMTQADAQKMEGFSWESWPDFAIMFRIR
jgi:hypothetical protein